jgi:hypothetical protein
MTSDYIYVRGTTAYLLDEYLPEATAEELIAASTKAGYVRSYNDKKQKAVSFNDPKEPLNNIVYYLHQMKKKRYVGADVVYGLA